MNKSTGLILLLVTLISVVGCQGKAKKGPDVARKIDPNSKLHMAISKCMVSTECNHKQWSFDADAVATIYENECRTLIAQHHLFNCESGKTDLTIDSQKAGGKVYEKIEANEKLVLNGKLCPDNTVACAAARLKLYCIALTAMNTLIMDNSLDIKYIDLENKGGISSHIIEAKGNILACCRENKLFDNDTAPTDTVRIWIDDKTGYIHRIWISFLKNVNSGEYGHITAIVGNYRLQKNGMKLPTSIEYIPSDKKANDSGKSILKIDLERFRFETDNYSSSTS